MEVELPADAPDKLLIAKPWSCIAFWTRGDSDFPEPVTYEQRTLVIEPGGEEMFDVRLSFVVSNQHVNYRNVGSVNGFPVTENGVLRVEVYLRKQGDEQWEKYSEFPIITERKIVEVALDDGKTRLEHADNEVSIQS